MTDLDEFGHFEPIVVVWEDAFTDATAQANTIKEALDSYRPTFRKSSGFYIGFSERRGRKALVIATEDDRENEPDSEACGGFTYIPSAMIMTIKHPPGRRRKRKQQVKD